jgi:hypothetical protein
MAKAPGNGGQQVVAPSTESTELDIFGDASPSPVDISELIAGLGNLGQSIAAAGGVGRGLSYLTLQPKVGHFAYGVERNRVEEDSEWIINMRTVRHGYTAWKDGAVAGELMLPINEKLPPVTELPDVGAKYQPSYSCEMKCLTGEDAGTSVLYKANSLGVRKFYEALNRAAIAQINAGKAAGITDANDLPVFPIIKLRSDYYSHKEYGPTYYPVFFPLRWVDRYGNTLDGSPGIKPGNVPPKEAPAEAPSSGVRRRRVG